MTAWPLPRPIIHRLTGVVTTNARASENASEPQNRRSDSPAVMAPGTPTMTVLSISSITAMETVSEASATFAACRSGTPARSTLRMVSA